MAYRVNWSPRAIDDVDSIAAYIAQDSEAYASAVVRKIFVMARTLSESPKRGRVVPEFGDEAIREILCTVIASFTGSQLMTSRSAP